MEKEQKKEKIDKLQKKLQNRMLSLEEVLQEDIAIDWFKMGHPALLALLNRNSVAQMIQYIVKPGPPDNRMRSYKIPMIATQILSTPSPKVFDLLFMEDQDAQGNISLGHLIKYFETPSNYIISGYVVRIMMNLMGGNAPRLLQFLMKTNVKNLLRYLQSHSIAEFMLRIIIVDDILLNSYIKERIALYNDIIDIYAQNKESVQILQNINYILAESVTRLWAQKHKELGRFSPSIFHLLQLVIDNNNLYQQQNIIIIMMKQLTTYSDQGPCLVVALYKKIYKQLLLHKNGDIIKNQAKISLPKFGLKNFKLLQALNYIFHNNPQSITKQLATANIFTFLIDFIYKYQWNSMVLVQIQKIFKSVFQSTNQIFFNAIFIQGHFNDKIRDMIRRQNDGGKFKRGYSGFLQNVLRELQNAINTHTILGQLTIRNYPDMKDLIANYLINKEQIFGYQVVHNVAKPYFSFEQLYRQFSQFFQETEIINKKYQIQRPKDQVKHIKEDVLHEIEKQNELVYKLMAQDNVNQEKKNENISESQ